MHSSAQRFADDMGCLIRSLMIRYRKYTNNLAPNRCPSVKRASTSSIFDSIHEQLEPLTSIPLDVSSDNLNGILRTPSEKGPKDWLKLNIGGAPFQISFQTIQRRPEVGLLYKFVTNSHEVRLRICDQYFEDTDEYFFERSPKFFDIIYFYYTTGLTYRPPTLPADVLSKELSYWGLTKTFFPEYDANERPVVPQRVDKFKDVRFSTIRRHVWNLCETPESSVAARLFAIASIAAVIISNSCLVLGSMRRFQINSTTATNESGRQMMEPHPTFEYIECVCIAFFTIEYLAKMIAAPDRKRVFLKFMNLIDLVAILPFYIELMLLVAGLDTAQMQDVQGALLVVRILRVLRVIRLFKLGRYSTGLRVFARVIRLSIPQLGMVLGVVGIGIMFFSTLVYYTEKEVEGTKFDSIPAAFWWCLVTITTVGYGDMVPHTVGGKLVASCAIACGVLVLSLPITVIVDAFMQVQEELHIKPEKTKEKDVKTRARR